MSWNKFDTMVEIIRIRPGGPLADGPYIPFEIKLEHPRDQYLHYKLVALLREESERLLKSYTEIAFDSVAFYFHAAHVPIETLADLIINNDFRLPGIHWEGKHDSHVPTNGTYVESTGSAIQAVDCVVDVQTTYMKQITIDQAEQCARDLVDIYHARYCRSKCDDFEHCDALLPRKNSAGRIRTVLEISVLAECDKKIAREIQNIAKRSDARVAKLRDVVEQHRRMRMSHNLSSLSCRQWYHRVGKHIESVLIRRRTCDSVDAPNESELLQLYPKGWFKDHVFSHLEGIHAENTGSSPDDVNTISGRNDRNIATEPGDLCNSNLASKAIQCPCNLTEMHALEIQNKDLVRFKEEETLQREHEELQREHEELRRTNEELRRKLAQQQNQTGDLDGPQSSQKKAIKENVLPIQNLVQLNQHSGIIEKGNIKDAPRKGRSKATKTQPKRVHGGNENIYRKEYRYTKKR